MKHSKKDIQNLLRKTENTINEDKGIVDYYTCNDESKADFEKRIGEIYLKQYSEDFDAVILDFDAFGRFYREPNALDFNNSNRDKIPSFTKLGACLFCFPK